VARILVVEDDPAIGDSLARGLTRAGYEVEQVRDGPTGRDRALGGGHDLLILDLGLPGLDGERILEAIQREGRPPTLVVSARPGPDPRVRAFQRGAVDFVPKPFWLEEVVARVAARLAPSEAPRRRLTFAEVVIDVDAHEVSVEGAPVELTPSEYAILLALAQRPGRAMTRRQLVEVALPEDADPLERTVDSHVTRIRKKLGASGAWVETVWGAGYRLRVAPRRGGG